MIYYCLVSIILCLIDWLDAGRGPEGRLWLSEVETKPYTQDSELTHPSCVVACVCVGMGMYVCGLCLYVCDLCVCIYVCA